MLPSASHDIVLEAPRAKGVRPSLRLLRTTGDLTLQRDRLEWARYDRAGRWRVAMVRGLEYRRALSGRVIAIRYYLDNDEEDGFHDVTEVGPEAAAGLHETIQAWAREAYDVFDAELSEDWRQVLERARGTGLRELEADHDLFRCAYTGDPITPPDQRAAVLLQSTTGCAHNACTFCTFYRGTRFGIRSAGAFAAHVDAVRRFLGPALLSRRRIFFGDASALMVRPSLLAQHFEAAARLLPQKPGQRTGEALDRPSVGPFAAFCDAFLTPLPAVPDLRELGRMGLGRVYLGIESGSPELLNFLNKPATPDRMLAAVRALKAAAISVSAIVMVGVGGQEFARVHMEETTRLLRSMSLGSQDAIQFSEFFCVPGSTYELNAARLGLRPLSRMECRTETRRMVQVLGLSQLDQKGIHAEMYDSRQLLY